MLYEAQARSETAKDAKRTKQIRLLGISNCNNNPATKYEGVLGVFILQQRDGKEAKHKINLKH